MPFLKCGETLASFSRAKVPIATRVRSTLIASSRAALREHGYYDRYLETLTPEERVAMDGIVPGVWVPVGMIRAHYLACGRLGLTVGQQLEMGHSLFARMHKPVFAVGVRLASAAGVTPWTLAEQAVKMWPRAYDGGDLLIEELGPKEMRIEILGFPCADLPYCRVAWRGILLGGTELFSRRAYVNEVPSMCGPTALAYRGSWA